MNNDTTFGLEVEGGPWPAFADLFAGVSLLFLVLFAAVTLPVMNRSHQESQKQNTIKKIEAALASDTVMGYTLHRSGNDLVVRIGQNATFPKDEYEIKYLHEEGKRILRGVAAHIRHKNLLEEIGEISVVGHTSADGIDEDNWGLSAQRAVTVAMFLITDQKLSPCLVSALGRGRYYPTDPRAAAAARGVEKSVGNTVSTGTEAVTSRRRKRLVTKADRRIELRISPIIKNDSSYERRKSECVE